MSVQKEMVWYGRGLAVVLLIELPARISRGSPREGGDSPIVKRFGPHATYPKPIRERRATNRWGGSTTAARRLVLFLVIAALSWRQPVIADERSPRLEQLFRAWSRRQEQTRSGQFHWEQETVEAKAGLGPANARETIVVQQSSVLRLDGNRLDYRVTTPDGANAGKPPFYRSAYDGEVSQQFHQSSDPDYKSSGMVTDVPHKFDINNIDIRPILLTYRAVHPTMLNLKPEGYRLRAKGGMIDGRTCMIIEETGDKSIRKSYWIDVERDYIVLRYASTVNGKESVLQNISYQEDSQHGWVPAQWKTVFVREDGSFGLSKTYRMTDYTINQAIPLEEFQIEFPVGTNVEDRVTGRTYDVQASASFGWLWLMLPLLVGAFLVLLVARRRRA